MRHFILTHGSAKGNRRGPPGQGNRISESEEVALRGRPFFLQKRPDFSIFLMLIWQDMAKGDWPRFLGWTG
jgi:hypothetical protein